MIEAVGHAVSRLIRIRYGAMVLPRGLKRGTWMELDERDIRALTQAAGMPQVAAARGERKSGGGQANGRRGSGKKAQGPGRDSGTAQPDPMKTSVGYIGADSFARQRRERQNPGPRRSGRRF